jgi:hypothetical protein
MRHLHDEVPKALLSIFSEFYTSMGNISGVPVWQQILKNQMNAILAGKEDDLAEKQRHLDARQSVIDQLQAAAANDRQIIGKLQNDAEERLTQTLQLRKEVMELRAELAAQKESLSQPRKWLASVIRNIRRRQGSE